MIRTNPTVPVGAFVQDSAGDTAHLSSVPRRNLATIRPRGTGESQTGAGRRAAATAAWSSAAFAVAARPLPDWLRMFQSIRSVSTRGESCFRICFLLANRLERILNEFLAVAARIAC